MYFKKKLKCRLLGTTICLIHTHHARGRPFPRCRRHRPVVIHPATLSLRGMLFSQSSSPRTSIVHESIPGEAPGIASFGKIRSGDWNLYLGNPGARASSSCHYLASSACRAVLFVALVLTLCISDRRKDMVVIHSRVRRSPLTPHRQHAVRCLVCST